MATQTTPTSTTGKPEGEKTNEQRNSEQHKPSMDGQAGGSEKTGSQGHRSDKTEDNKGGWEKGPGMNKGDERAGATGMQRDRDQSDHSGSDAETASDTDTDGMRDADKPGAGRATNRDKDENTAGGSSTSGGM